jgi:hypothetical protein
MKQVQHYFRGHKFIFWLALVVISFAVYAGGQALFGPPHWFFVIGMSIAQPTEIVLISNISGKR